MHADDGEQATGAGRRAPWALAALTLAVAVLHLVTTRDAGRPTVSFDEIGYLGTARWLTGRGARWEMPTSPLYAVGYPLVLAVPLRWFATADAQWRAVLATNAALLAAVVPLAHAVARRVLAADRRTALLAAAVAGTAPAVVAAAPTAAAEALALPLGLAVVLAAHRTLSPGPLLRRAWFGPAVAALHLTHNRYVLVLGLAVGLLAVGARARLVPAAVAAANAAGGLVVFGVGRALTAAVRADRWDHVERIEGSLGDALGLFTSTSGLAEVARTAVGQAWYVAAGSLGLAVVGLAWWGRTAARPGSTGAAGSPRSEAAARRLTAVFALAAGVAVFATSVALFAQVQFRADHLVYGRHNDAFAPLWATAAVVALVRAPRGTAARLLAAAAATTVGSWAVLATVRDSGGDYAPFGVPALSRYVAASAAGVWWQPTLVAVVALATAAVVTVGLRRPTVLVPALVAWGVWAGTGTVQDTARYEDLLTTDLTGPAEVRALGIAHLAIDVRAVEVAVPVLTYGWALPGVDVTTYDPALGDEPDAPFVLSAVDDPARLAEGARVAFIDRSGVTTFQGPPAGLALWARPGPEADRLAAAGALLPAGWPVGLPDPARAVSLTVDTSDRTVVSGEGVRLAVTGRHEGSGSPWPAVANDSGASRVRIKARVTALDPGGVDGATSGGELPGWLRPGAAFTSEVEVLALDGTLGPLAPGRYRVDLGVGQDDPEWFAPAADATFTLTVTAR